MRVRDYLRAFESCECEGEIIMPSDVKLGQMPDKRHSQFRKADGTLYAEQVFGTRGFSGISSTLYHCHLPTQVESFAPLGDLHPEFLPEQPVHHRHLKTWNFEPNGDPISVRTALM